MELRPLGCSGLRVSALGVGGNQFGATVDQETTVAIIDIAQRLGINFIDTSDVYGETRSEEFLGKALRGRRDEFIVATKTGSPQFPEGRLSRRTIVRCLEASLRRLDTDHVDIFYLHFPDPGTPLVESLEALDDLVRAGKILYPALSNHPAWQVAEAVGLCTRRGWHQPVASQNLYNLLGRAVEAELLPALRHFGIGLVPFYPLAAGFLTGKYQPGVEPPPGVRAHSSRMVRDMWLRPEYFEALERFDRFAEARGHTTGELALAWLLGHREVSSVIAGARRPDQLEANARAIEWRLTPEEMAEL
jgi:aryl-alcohol dehydrogenase-like predicted oxidoreductase